jgi:hypothetical protein
MPPADSLCEYAIEPALVLLDVRSNLSTAKPFQAFRGSPYVQLSIAPQADLQILQDCGKVGNRLTGLERQRFKNSATWWKDFWQDYFLE